MKKMFYLLGGACLLLWSCGVRPLVVTVQRRDGVIRHDSTFVEWEVRRDTLIITTGHRHKARVIDEEAIAIVHKRQSR